MVFDADVIDFAQTFDILGPGYSTEVILVHYRRADLDKSDI